MSQGRPLLANPSQAWPVLSLALALALPAACTSPEARPIAGRSQGPVARPSTSASPSQGPGGLVASQGPSTAPQGSATPASSEAQATGVVKLSLPGRLGLALPSALVGAQAQARLSGKDGSVAPPGTQLLALADGRIISNNSGAIVANNSGNLVANHGGGLLSDHGGARRILQASATTVRRDGTATAPIDDPLLDPRLNLWLLLTLVDLDDQILQAFLQAKPVVGEWRSLPAVKLSLLPLPTPIPLLEALIAQVVKELESLHYAGILSDTPQGPRLLVVMRPEGGTPLAEALPFFDLQASGTSFVARTRFFPSVERLFGFNATAARFEGAPSPQGPSLDIRFADFTRDYPSPGNLAFVLHPKDKENARRLVRLQPRSATAAMALSYSRTLSESLSRAPMQHRSRNSIGYSPEAGSNLGLATYRRESFTTLEAGPAFTWRTPFTSFQPDEGLPWPVFILPEGIYSQAAPPALAALLPPYSPADDALIPELPKPGEDATQDPGLKLEPLSAELLLAPFGP